MAKEFKSKKKPKDNGAHVQNSKEKSFEPRTLISSQTTNQDEE